MTLKERTELLRDGKIVGSKRIILYLKKYMNLHPEPSEAWRTIKRWRKKYNLPIHYEINRQPSIIPDEIMFFFGATSEGLKEGVTKGEFRKLLKKCQ